MFVTAAAGRRPRVDNCMTLHRSDSVVSMSGDRGDLHRLVDELDEQLLVDAAALLRTLKPAPVVPSQPRWRLSMSGAYDSGRSDTATQSAEILREGLGGRDPYGR
ncbi:MAG: hypothetical protein M3308_06665 [Actinomycetota bacterium]|nr:hypothetical protein [Actinomycetota bacterium]